VAAEARLAKAEAAPITRQIVKDLRAIGIPLSAGVESLAWAEHLANNGLSIPEKFE
jgi:hypothetical protein